MTNKLAPLYRISLIFFFVVLVLQSTSCGGSHVNFNPTSATETEAEADAAICDDTGEDVTTDNMTITVSGDPCDTPVSTVNQTDEIIVDCSEPRSTSLPDEDYITATCGSGDNTDVEDYYCSDGIVYRGSDDTALFDATVLTCTVDETEVRIIEEEELIVG